MEKLTQEFLDELLATQEKLSDMYEKLDDCICELSRWKNENLDKKSYCLDGQITGVSIENDKLIIKTFGFNYREECYEEDSYSYSLSELLSDDWKKQALKEYQIELEKKREERRIKDEALARKKEEKERAEFLRLKAKYGE